MDRNSKHIYEEIITLSLVCEYHTESDNHVKIIHTIVIKH